MNRNPKTDMFRVFLFIMLMIGVLFLSLLLSGCSVSEKQRREICATCPVHDFKDSSTKITERVIHDTLRLPGLPGPMQYLKNPCSGLCDSAGNLKAIDIKAEKNGIKTEIKSDHNSLVFSAEKDSSKVPINEKEITINSKVETKGTIILHEPCLDERTVFDKIGHYCFWILLFEVIILILWAIYKIRSGRLHK